MPALTSSPSPRNSAPSLPLHRLQRHPLPIRAHFDFSLVLTFAFPKMALAPLLPPGLTLDTHQDLALLAIALVQTRHLRPAFLPPHFGQSSFLAGYRLFVRFKPTPTSTLRGLFILRSDTDRRAMAFFGNLLTHYNYRNSSVALTRHTQSLRCQILTKNHRADLDITADLTAPPALPPSSPFTTLHEARRFAGPLPYTFDYEPQTHSIVAIKALRQNWNPRLLPVHIDTLSFLNQDPFASFKPQLASAFFIENIDYQWNPGIVHRLDRNPPSTGIIP